MRRSLSSAFLLLALAAPGAGAQAAVDRPAAPVLAELLARHRSDSAAAVRVFTHVWDILAPRLMAVSLDTTPHPWTLTLAASAVPRERLRAHLWTALRARAPLPSDSLVSSLRVEPIQIRGDTAWARITVTDSRHCQPGVASQGSSATVYDVVVARATPSGPWGQARTRHAQHMDFERCQAAGP